MTGTNKALIVKTSVYPDSFFSCMQITHTKSGNRNTDVDIPIQNYLMAEYTCPT